ncbi:APC family permease [Vibrio inusitatus]|uniref:APC family permease n=1 Tax=Vibrio inusitatus TaxID=413402 RepID=UPI001144A5A3|nr:APC family permease [Vibrio inusitatus]
MKNIGKIELFTIALGSVIGWGAFMLPGTFFLNNAGVLNTLIGFSVAIVMIAIIESNYSVLMSKYRSKGGEYTFAREEFGNKVGFSTGWVLLLAYVSIIPLNATAIPMVFEKVLPFYSKGLLLYTIVEFPVYLNDLIISLTAIFFFCYVQLRGLNFSSTMQNTMVFILLVCVVILFIGTLTVSSPVHYENFESNYGNLDINSVIKIISFAPWAFIGFDTVAQVSSESKVNAKTASLMALVAVIFGGFVYNAINVVTAFGLPNESLNAHAWATGDAVYNLMGPVALIIVGLAMFGAVLSGLNGFFMTSTRLTAAMVPSHFTKRCGFREVIIFVSLISMIVPFFGRNALFWFVDISSVGASFAYLVTSLAAYKLSNTRIRKCISVAGIGCSLLFLIFLLTPFFESNIPLVSTIVLFLWCVFGLVIFNIFSINGSD